jgi:hypothetical protein
MVVALAPRSPRGELAGPLAAGAADEWLTRGTRRPPPSRRSRGHSLSRPWGAQ